MKTKQFSYPRSIIYACLIFAMLLCIGCAQVQPALSPENFSEPIRVACVGDSITQGVGASRGKSYPSQMQEMLGPKWKVGNFGVSGRTLLRKGDFPYWKENAFKKAQEFNPNAVVIMLGTNDTKSQNWKYIDEFTKDYTDLVNTFRNLPTKPRIFICRPPVAPGNGNFGINEPNILAEIKMLDKLAADLKVTVIDNHAIFIGKESLLPDRVHPNDEGSRLMAETVSKALTASEKTTFLSRMRKAFSSSAAPAKTVARKTAPEDGNGAYATGKYRNLFAEAGHSQKEINAKIEKAYQQLFHGDKDTQLLFFPAGQNENGPMAYIPDIQHSDVRSEGMSYGMMIAVQLNKKADFDALWNWSMTYMYNKDPEHPSYGYFSWQMRYDGTAISEMPAPDGEEYYAMALLFAANRWGNSKGIYNYKEQADKLLRNMVHREWINGYLGMRPINMGPEVNLEHNMILFSPHEENTVTDPSYHLPAFYELWSRWGPAEDRAFWAKAAQVSRDHFVKVANPKTGLTPNMSNFDGTLPKRGADFREDAWRCAMNWSVDWAWFAKDPRQRELSDRIQTFFKSKGMNKYNDNWTLDGESLRNRHSPGLVSTNAVASLAATNKGRSREFVEALWNTEVPSSFLFRYYDGLLYMMSLLHCSGQFQILEPQQ